MRVTISFFLAPGPYQVETITYRMDGIDAVEALEKALTQASQVTTVPVASIAIEGDPLPEEEVWPTPAIPGRSSKR
jgi:hypothetical protein